MCNQNSDQKVEKVVGNHIDEAQIVMSDKMGANKVDQELIVALLKHDVTLNNQANNVKIFLSENQNLRLIMIVLSYVLDWANYMGLTLLVSTIGKSTVSQLYRV